jgi:hypothetical protein
VSSDASAAKDERESAVESRWEAAPSVLLVIVLQLLLMAVSQHEHWRLWTLPWWTWWVVIGPEAALVAPLAFSRPRHQLEQMGMRRTVALGLFGLVSAGNGAALVALIGSLLNGHETNGTELLYKGATIWTANMISFGLWYWTFDGGGPVARRQAKPRAPDFQFPQMDNPKFAQEGWYPEVFDYIYVSFTNSIAFSPTDTMPLTRKAKLLMLIQSSASAITVLLVAARAVNILR